MGRLVFRRSATPLNLHKCIARFVTDSEFLVGIDISDTFPLYIGCISYKN